MGMSQPEDPNKGASLSTPTSRKRAAFGLSSFLTAALQASLALSLSYLLIAPMVRLISLQGIWTGWFTLTPSGL